MVVKRGFLLIFAVFLTLTLSTATPTNAIFLGLDWSFQAGDDIYFRMVSDSLVDDEIIRCRIVHPLPESVELPPDTYNIDALHDWMDIPLVGVSSFIPNGTLIDEVHWLANVFPYGGLAAADWCRFALPIGNSWDTYEELVERWDEGPHGDIVVTVIQHTEPFLFWGLKYGFEFSGDIYNVTVWYHYESKVLADITIVSHDSVTEEQTHYLKLVSDPTVPTITSQQDAVTILFGTTGEELVWNTDDIPPYDYEVFRNGELLQSGSLDTNPLIHVSLDGLEVGVWNFTAVVSDYLGNTASDTIIVTVTSGTEILVASIGIGAIAIAAIIVFIKRR